MGRTTLIQGKKHILSRLIDSNENAKSSPEVESICNLCKSVVGRGLGHECTRASYNDNIEKIIRQSSGRTLNRILQTSLKTSFKRAGIEPRGGEMKLPRVGKKGGKGGLKLVVGTKCHRFVPPRRFTRKDLLKLQVEYSLSDRQTLGYAKASRVIHGRRSVEPSFDKALVERNHLTDQFFEIKSKEFEKLPSKQKKMSLVAGEKMKLETITRTGVNLNLKF